MHTIFKAFLLGITISILGVLSYWIMPGYDIEENFGLDLLFTVRGERVAPQNTVIIAIDKIASDYYRLPNNPAKWPRELHAQLIQYLHSEQVAVIAIDIFFKDAKNAVSDQLLANAIRESNNVVLFTHLKRELLNQFGTTPRTRSDELFNVERLIYPTSIIASAPNALAPFALSKYPSKVSKFWSFRIPAGETATMPVVALQLLLLKQKSFRVNLNKLEKEIHIKFPVFKTTQTNNKNVNVNRFVSEMKDWSKQHQQVINNLSGKIKKGYYNSIFSESEKLSLLQFLNLYSGNNRHHLNFFGPPRSITTFTFDAVLNKQLPTNFTFKDKIVFIGFSERLQPEQIDNFNTVFSQKNGVDLSGVEIAATAFSNLYDLNSISTPNSMAYLILIAVFGFTVAFLARLLSNITAIVNLSVISIGYFAISYYLFTIHSLWLPIIIPIFLLVPISLFSSISWQYIETNKERKRIRKAFGFYLPDEVVNDLAKQKGNVQNSQNLMYGICMATDAEQYTALSENLSPAKLSSLVNQYYEILFKPVRNNNGTISDVIGDAMLAIWTTHNPDLKLRQNACYTSLQIQEALGKLQQDNKSHALVTRIGLHSGNIVIGNVGAVDHYEYRAVGDIVNTANRIQGLNKQLKTKIIASFETLRDIPDLLVRELGDFKLAGKTNAINLYEILNFKVNPSTELTLLLTKFKTALSFFKAGDIEQALLAFKQICEIYPADGPALFFVKYCESLLKDESYVKLNWEGIVKMEKK